MPRADDVADARVSWCVEDIQDRRPGWDEQRCLAFLEENEDAIQCEMIAAGWRVIDHYLRWEKD